MHLTRTRALALGFPFLVVLRGGRLLSPLFSSDYLPHRFCYLAKPWLIWTNVTTDSLIAVSYSVIFACLLWMVSRLRRVPELQGYLWIFVSFSLFILACGTTHLMDVVTVWVPVYPLSATAKIVCAVISVPTAVFFAWRTPAIRGSIVSYFDLVKDNQQQTVRALRKMEAFLDRTGRLASVGGWEFELGTKAVVWSEQTHRIFGEPLGPPPDAQGVLERYTPESRQILVETAEAALRSGNGWDLELEAVRRDGQTIWVRSVGTVEYEAGAPVRLAGAIQDITAHVAHEEALRQANERVALATDSGRIGIWDWDIATGTLTWDKWTCLLYGYDPGSVVPAYQLWIDRLHPDDSNAAQEAVMGALKDGQPLDTEFRMVWQDGSVHYIRAAGRVTRDAAGNAKRMVGAIWDVTERRQLEAEKERLMKQELKFKDDFLSHVSHELRSPLASIYSFTSIMADGIAGETTSDQKQYLDIVLKNSAQLQAMIEDLLDVTQSREGKLSVDPRRTLPSEAIVECFQTLSPAAADKQIELYCEDCEDLPPVLADPTRLRQVLIILLDNAVKYTGEGGRVGVKAFRRRKDSLMIQVSDTGCGIPPDKTEKIFDHLYQIGAPGKAGRNGLGLGLHIAKELVLRQGGKIWITSEVGKGSVFSFTLPTYTETHGSGSRDRHEQIRKAAQVRETQFQEPTT
jgi:PAS domain S-box-containing protein